MPTPHVSKGTRVYLSKQKMFGDVVKTKMLGTDAVVVQCDNGSLQVACGKDVLEEVVDKSTSKNGRGSSRTLPTDVKVIGPQVLESFGVDEQTRAVLFQKFMVLEESVRLEKATYWEVNRDNAEAMSSFLPELLSLIGEDTLFIQRKSARLLRHLDHETREVMLQNMMSKTTEEERKTMIMHYTSVQSDRRKLLEFLQDMYELLLDDKTYLKMEFNKAFTESKNKVVRGVTAEAITNFLESSSESLRAKVVAIWRKRKYYRSRRGGRYAYNVLRRFKEV